MTDREDDLAIASEEKKADDEEEHATKSSLTTTTDWLSNNPSCKEWIDEWTRLGLSKYGVSLPMICVLGDTSSGKSSVLSSLIGIELPSASTLTTKCPVLIQLLKGSERATVDVQWHSHIPSPRQKKRTIEKQVEASSPVKESSTSTTATSTNIPPPPPPPPPPPFMAKTLVANLETELPKTIQQAQDFILEYRETMVAPDVVCVTLYSSSVEEELTLVDLPGLVQFQHTHDVSLLSQVEHVIWNYLHNPRSILLPVVAAPTNIFNSKALQLAQTVDPTTQRTIPVLTKPDLMDPGSESDVLDLMLQASPGSSFQHGFFLVKNRGQADLDAKISIAKGLAYESEYFDSTLPWNALPKNLGIPALRQTCAKVLWQVMKDTLPEILKDLNQLLADTQDQLDAMGTRYHTKSDQRKFFHSLVQTVVSQMSNNLSGKGSPTNRRSHHIRRGGPQPKQQLPEETTPRGASQLHTACHEFFKEIQAGSLATITSLVEGATVLVSSNGSVDDVKGELVYIDHTLNYCCVDYVDIKDHTAEVLFDAVGYTSGEDEFDIDEVWSDGSRVFIGRNNNTFDSLRKLSLHRIRTDPSWLEEKMQQYRTDDLVCFVNVDMFRSIVAEFVQDDWAPPCHKLLEMLETLLRGTLDQALKEVGESTRYPLLKDLLECSTSRVAKELLDDARNHVEQHLQMEQQHPYTQDHLLLEAMNQARFQTLQKDLAIQLRLDTSGDKSGSEGGTGVVYDTQAIQSILDRVFEKHSKQNWMAEQMELVLSCYGKVATQRVLDRTPQLCWQTCRQLPSKVQEELGCITDDVLEKCLWESPASREKYLELTQKLHDLTKAMEVVQQSIR